MYLILLLEYVKEIKKKYPEHFHDILQGHAYNVLSINFSEDGTKIVTGSADKSVIIFNEELKQEIVLKDCHTSAV